MKKKVDEITVVFLLNGAVLTKIKSRSDRYTRDRVPDVIHNHVKRSTKPLLEEPRFNFVDGRIFSVWLQTVDYSPEPKKQGVFSNPLKRKARKGKRKDSFFKQTMVCPQTRERYVV